MTISQNNRLLKSLLSSTEKDNIVKSLEAFQVEANNAITQMIQLLDNEANEARAKNKEAKAEEGEEEDDEDKNKAKDGETRKRDDSNGQEENGESKPKKKRCG